MYSKLNKVSVHHYFGAAIEIISVYFDCFAITNCCLASQIYQSCIKTLFKFEEIDCDEIKKYLYKHLEQSFQLN